VWHVHERVHQYRQDVTIDANTNNYKRLVISYFSGIPNH
jgi:hypothetical protein